MVFDKKKYYHDYHLKNRERINKRKKNWRLRNPDKTKMYNARLYEKRKKQKPLEKLQVFQHYSKGIIKCACCKEKEYDFLCIDHINGKKAVGHTKEHSSYRLYKWLISHGFPEGFQVLCFNCNLAKLFFDICPHKRPKNCYKLT